jgi:hypothetical protein
MNATPKLPRRHPVTSALAVVLSVVIAVALLGGVTELFQRDGTPFEQLVAAEHECTNYAYASEREACVRVYLATARLRVLAHQ